MSESSRRHKREAPTQLAFAIVMCSTSRFARLQEGKQANDPSGDFIVQALENTGHRVVSRVLVSDDERMIKEAVEEALQNRRSEVVIICGGTGIAPEDVTVETVSPILDKRLPGFGELFRRLSYDEIGSAAVLSRAIGGVACGKPVFCVPGSTDAVKLCLDKLILPEAGHIVKHARERHR